MVKNNGFRESKFYCHFNYRVKIELETEEGKRMKSLPKPNAKDNVEKAEEAKN